MSTFLVKVYWTFDGQAIVSYGIYMGHNLADVSAQLDEQFKDDVYRADIEFLCESNFTFEDETLAAKIREEANV